MPWDEGVSNLVEGIETAGISRVSPNHGMKMVDIELIVRDDCEDMIKKIL